MSNNVLEAALKYHSRGYSVIPIKPDFDEEKKKFLKKPYVKWADFQTRLSSEDEIREWWGKWPKAMIGLITGHLSGLCAVDCDSDAAYNTVQSLLPDSYVTPIVISPRGGRHIWFHCSNGNMLPQGQAILPSVDVRGVGGYIIAPPSVNEHGGAYRWSEGLSALDDEAALQ